MISRFYCSFSSDSAASMAVKVLTVCRKVPRSASDAANIPRYRSTHLRND